MGLVDGSVSIPEETDPTQAEWAHRDQQLMSLLITSLSKDVLLQVVGLTSSRDVWESLVIAFGSFSHTRILQLQLQNLRKGDTPISSFLRQAKFFTDELAAAGQPVSIANFNAIIFNNLSADFNEMVTALSIRANPIPFPELHSLLLSHEIQLSTQHLSNIAAANIAQMQTSSRS
uniref:Uncharacterized protein LOC105061103 n=1 Tax=Elaeis guineensis var. tenera TaxID=51953 RepID=A0A6I9SIF1_ELAGV|nr:uncharacterized protein LOC105061103 [Elaeis guineensis]